MADRKSITKLRRSDSTFKAVHIGGLNAPSFTLVRNIAIIHLRFRLMIPKKKKAIPFSAMVKHFCFVYSPVTLIKSHINTSYLVMIKSTSLLK